MFTNVARVEVSTGGNQAPSEDVFFKSTADQEMMIDDNVAQAMARQPKPGELTIRDANEGLQVPTGTFEKSSFGQMLA